jgi:hypothetical protein
MGVERLACGYDSATVFLALGYCITSRRAGRCARARVRCAALQLFSPHFQRGKCFLPARP